MCVSKQEKLRAELEVTNTTLAKPATLDTYTLFSSPKSPEPWGLFSLVL